MAQGIGAWEAKCHRSDWQALRSDGQPIFPIACGDDACAKGVVTKQEGKAFKVIVAKACEANSIEALPLETTSSNVVSTGSSLNANLALSGTQKTGTIDLNGLDPKYNKLRIFIKQGSQILWTSNPSPSINLNGDGASSQDTVGADPSVNQGSPLSPNGPVPFPAAQPQIVNPPK
jgi:hypothetical protein